MKAADSAKERLRELRARAQWVDHAVRAYDRDDEVLGGRLAAAVTYFAFLSFFPLLALAFALVGYVSSVYPDAQDDVMRVVEGAFPSLVGPGEGQLDITEVIGAKKGAGLLGLLGLLYAGLGWLDALRDGLRRVFGTDDVAIGLLRKKLVDVLVLVLLGLSLLVSLAVSSLATSATTRGLDLAGLDESTTATALLKVLSVVLAVLVDVVIFAILLSRLSGAKLPWRQVRSGALLAAGGFAVLKLAGTFLVAHTTSNPLYATFGVVVGLLVWINLVSRLTIFAGAWTATRASSLGPAYEAAPPPADEAAGSSRSGGRLRGVLLGAGLGAAVTAVVSRRRSRG